MPVSAYLEWLRGHGVRFDVAPDLARHPDHDGPLAAGSERARPVELEGVPPFVEHRDPEAGIAADHATFSLCRAMLPRLRTGCRFWDVGCGTGVLATAAGLAGARSVLAIDIDPRAIALARRTASEAGIAAQFLQGSLLAPIPPDREADLVAANLPHKPVPRGWKLPLCQAGGPDGDGLHRALLDQVSGRAARIVFFLHSLPHPRLLARYTESFRLSLLAWKRRFLQPGEYGPLEDHFLARRDAGTSYLAVDEGRHFLVAGVWVGERR